MAVNRTLAGKTIFISGGSRGIGLAIALRAAHDGANIAIAAKTSEPHCSMSGTIGTAVRQIEEAGGRLTFRRSSIWPKIAYYEIASVTVGFVAAGRGTKTRSRTSFQRAKVRLEIEEVGSENPERGSLMDAIARRIILSAEPGQQ
jgi:NAD(P)-dependent dehydrogenase (short-subunit alcohol dehydrogenase family)